MDIVRFTAGASAEALAGNTDGDRIAGLGAELVFRNLGAAGCQRRPTLARGAGGRVSYLPGSSDFVCKALLGSRHAGSSHGFRQACPGQQPDEAGPFGDLQTPQLADLRPARLK